MRNIITVVLLAVSIAAFAQDPNASPQVGNAERGRAMLNALGPTGLDFNSMSYMEKIEYSHQVQCDRIREQIQIQLDYEAAGSRGVYDLKSLRQALSVHCPTPAQTAARAAAEADARPALRTRYIAAMTQFANSNWNPVDAPAGVHCQIVFTQIPGGEVIGKLSYQNCPFDAVARETIEHAMRKQPMPYTGFERVFARQVTIDFCHPARSCTVYAQPIVAEQTGVTSPDSLIHMNAAATVAAGRGYAVQVSAFRSEEEALALRNRLRVAGFTAFSERIQADSDTLYRVVIGPETDRDAAEQMRVSLSQKMGLSGMVVAYP